jgi:hypothetical protein
VSAPIAADYERLAALAEHELELVGEGQLDQLDELVAERGELIARLPSAPPDWAAPALERAALMQRRVMIELTRRREAVLLELATVERARRMASGYAPPRHNGARVHTSA